MKIVINHPHLSSINLKAWRLNTKLVSIVFIISIFTYGLPILAQNSLRLILPRISEEEIQKIGQLIFINECGGKIENLLSWNEGEDFASLGIGHFLWYPKGKEGLFQESFPLYLEFLKQNGVKLPGWIEDSQDLDSPWNTREEFIRNKDHKMTELRELLIETTDLQTVFIIERFKKSVPKLFESAPIELHDQIKTQLYRVAYSTMGMYALIDYVNFKGDGTRLTERYKGEGWGLLQVLEEMHGTEADVSAVEDFATAAIKVLKRRASNSPPERNEKRWIPGWENRVRTYVSEAKK